MAANLDLVDQLFKDLTDRYALTFDWWKLNPAVKNEIRVAWNKIIATATKKDLDDANRCIAVLEERIVQEREKGDELASKNAILLLRLGNLLARIHRDGGQYVEQHGWEKAAADADLIIADLHTRSEKS